MSMVARSASRVKEHTDESINQRIQYQTQANIAFYAAHPEQIDHRLDELDREWDVERWLELNSSALSLLGLMFSATRGRHWLLLPMVVQGFFLQHSVQGWCPPLPVFRRLGVRTQQEIQTERNALKALRGDYKQTDQADAVLAAAEQ